MSERDGSGSRELDPQEPTSDTPGPIEETWLPPVVAEPRPAIASRPEPPAAHGPRAGGAAPAARQPQVPPGATGEPRWPLYLMIGSFAVLAVALALWWSSRSSSSPEVPLPITAFPTGSPAAVVPTGQPTGSASPISPASGYAFLATGPDGSPYRWNPCSSIRYAVNTANAPSGGLADVQEAARRISLATGITFEFAGATSETVAQRRANGYVVAEPGGAAWAPVLIAWLAPAEFQGLGYDPAATGAGGPFPDAPDVGQTTGQYVSGLVALNAGASPAPPNGFATPTSWGIVVMHELGHVVGLGHVDDPAEIMNAGLDQPRIATDWGAGDRQGLALVGRQAGCLPSVPAPSSA